MFCLFVGFLFSSPNGIQQKICFLSCQQERNSLSYMKWRHITFDIANITIFFFFIIRWNVLPLFVHIREDSSWRNCIVYRLFGLKETLNLLTVGAQKRALKRHTVNGNCLKNNVLHDIMFFLLPFYFGCASAIVNSFRQS